MEQVAIWTAILLPVGISFFVWLFNSIVTNKINDLNKRHDESEEARKTERDLFFKRLDDVKEEMSKNYVRLDMYKLAMDYHSEKSEAKIRGLGENITIQFKNLEAKIEDFKKSIDERLNGAH